MSTKVVLCDTPDGLARLQYALITSGAALDIEVVTDGLRAVEVAARVGPDIVVVETGLAGLAGSELIRRLRATVPDTAIVCWAAEGSPVRVAEMLGAGAVAYVLKQDGPDAVFRAMRTVRAGSIALSPRVAARLAKQMVGDSDRTADLEAALENVSERLDELTTAKADFIANVSHELRTPVTIARGIAYVLRNPNLAAEQRDEFVTQLEVSLEKLTALIDEMLAVADLDRGTLSLEVEESDLTPILRRVADEVGRQYEAVPLDIEVPETLRGAADPMRFIEIVRQLLDNACRFSPPGQPVLLKGRLMDEGVLVSVTDRGEGLAREVASKAFEEPFTAGEEILRKERAGAGVGLHLARQLVIEHGGIMWVDPVPAGGTRVSFVIPARPGSPVPGVKAPGPALPASIGPAIERGTPLADRVERR
jgi:signal transduction histidine kinase